MCFLVRIKKVKCCNIMAAATEIFKLSVKPTIGLVRYPSVISLASSEISFFSLPKTSEKGLLLISILVNITALESGTAANILKFLFFNSERTGFESEVYL